jgi:hypothetical protein
MNVKYCLSFALVALALTAAAGENFIRNGGFDQLWGWNNRPVNKPTAPFEGWYWKGGVNAKALPAGQIELTAPGTLLRTPPDSVVPAREYVLVLDVKTKDAKGLAILNVAGKTLLEPAKPVPADAPWSWSEFLDGARKPVPAKHQRRSTNMGRVALPKNTQGNFQTLSVRVAFKPDQELPAEAVANFSLQLQSGSCVVDNVRVESTPAAAAFRPARNEWLTVGVDGVPAAQLPSFTGRGKRKFRVTNTSGEPLSGTLTLAIDTWRTPGQGTAWKATRKLKKLAPGKSVVFKCKPGKLAPDAYVAAALLETDGQKVVTVSTEPLPLEKKVLTEGYNLLCFAVYPAVKPAKIVGVGNGMIGRFFTIDDVDKARDLGLVSVQANGMVGAAFGAPFLASETIDQADHLPRWSPIDERPELAKSRNPLNPRMLDIFTPEARKEIVRRGEIYGKRNREIPGAYALRINNEKAYFNRNSHCPSPAADTNFRQWCKARHGSLETLNLRWGTTYQSWDEVEQVISARMIDLAKASYEEKTGAAATDWKASSTFLRGEGYEKQLRANWARTMDWMRWTTDSTLWLYSTFTEAARKHDPDTLYSNCFCWPNFWPAVVMPHFRAAQSAQLDVQYCAGFDGGARHDRHLGNNDEMFDILEMTESVIPGKPILGNEIYVQPVYDADYPALQNWGLVAHGMSNILTFGWKKFSDHGYNVFYDKEKKQPVTRYWEQPDSIACWMLFDTDGTELPIYDSVAKSSHEIADFHKKYDFWSTQRLPSRVGWYLANDSSELVVPISANRPWDNPILTARFTLSSFLRRNGVTMDYLDDADLKRMKPSNFDTIIVPPAPVLSDEAATALAAFAQKGGRLIVVGPTGVYDPWLNRRTQFGGNAWSEINAGWKVPERWRNPDTLMVDMVAYPVHKGSALWASISKQESAKAKIAEKQIMTMPETALPSGQAVSDFGQRRKWGKGEIIAVSTFPERRTQMPYAPPALREYMEHFLEATGLPRNGYFRYDGKIPADNHKQLLGRGVPEVEVVVRKKGKRERFVFVLNCGGAGSGSVVLPGSAARVVDVLANETPVPFKHQDGNSVIPVKLASWGYRVLRLTF